MCRDKKRRLNGTRHASGYRRWSAFACDIVWFTMSQSAPPTDTSGAEIGRVSMTEKTLQYEGHKMTRAVALSSLSAFECTYDRH